MLLGIFAWCTLCYGLSYSNLSYRTVVRTGPYYFFRHPAYIVKLLSFAMLHVPWVDLRGDNGAYFPAIYYSQHYSLHIIIVTIISLFTPLHPYHYPPPPPPHLIPIVRCWTCYSQCPLSTRCGRDIRNTCRHRGTTFAVGIYRLSKIHHRTGCKMAGLGVGVVEVFSWKFAVNVVTIFHGRL